VKLLPWDWWKLSFLWFFQLKSRSPQAKQGLFRTSFRVSIFSLGIGIGALSVTLALVSGFEWTLGQAVQKSTGHVFQSFNRWHDLATLEKMVSSAPAGVERADFIWSSQGLVVGKKGGRGVLIEGRRAAKGFPLASSTSAGSLAVDSAAENSSPSSAPSATNSSKPQLVKVILGKPLATYLGVERGETVRILLPGVIEGSLEASVEDLVSNGIYEMDSRLLIVDDESLRTELLRRDVKALENRPGDAHGIRFFLDPIKFSPYRIKELEAWIARYKEQILKMEPDEASHRLVHWRDAKSPLFKGIEYNKRELSLVMALLTLVAALNIGATLVVLFLERDRDVAILQALGLGPWQVLQWVGIQGLILGVLSSLVGLGVGRAFGWLLQVAPFAKVPEDVYNISSLPLHYDGFEQSSVFLFGIGVALFASLVLGLRLSKMNLLSVLGTRR
jgi:lipoprotein-releasing system permease protein